MQALRSRFALGSTPRAPQFPERLKGGRLEKWKNYWLGVGIDYREASLELVEMAKGKPVKAAIFGATTVFMGYCVKTNPNEQDYRDNFINNGLDLMQLSDQVRNPGSDNLQNYVARAFNQNLIRRSNYGIFSLMWVDDYAPELGVFAARCEYMKPGWADMRYRVVDVGFLGRWWISERKMVDYDVNTQEWTESGSPVQSNAQL